MQDSTEMLRITLFGGQGENMNAIEKNLIKHNTNNLTQK